MAECKVVKVQLYHCFFKNKKINLKYFYHIMWIHHEFHETCIQISTNIPGIGLVFPEIAIEILEFSRRQKISVWQNYVRV